MNIKNKMKYFFSFKGAKKVTPTRAKRVIKQRLFSIVQDQDKAHT